MWGVLQAGGGSDLPLEALWTQGSGQLGMQDLESDLSVVPEVVRQVHRCHAPTPKFTLKPVTVDQALLQSLAYVGGHGPFTSRSKRGLPRSGSNVGSILSQPGER
jgi:hypothetical protein